MFADKVVVENNWKMLKCNGVQKADSCELKKNVISITWKCCRWNFHGTEKDFCQFLGLKKKGKHKFAGMLEQAVIYVDM